MPNNVVITRTDFNLSNVNNSSISIKMKLIKQLVFIYIFIILLHPEMVFTNQKFVVSILS